MKKYLILTLIACLAVFLITSPSLSRLPGELVLPERNTAPNASTNTNKIYNLNDETTIVDEDGNTLVLSPGSGVSTASGVTINDPGKLYLAEQDNAITPTIDFGGYGIYSDSNNTVVIGIGGAKQAAFSTAGFRLHQANDDFTVSSSGAFNFSDRGGVEIKSNANGQISVHDGTNEVVRFVQSGTSIHWIQDTAIPITSAHSASSPYPLWLNGSSPVIVTVASGITDHIGFNWNLSGVHSGDSIYCLGNVSFDGVGDASQKSGVTLVSMTAPWDITIVYRGDANSGACLFVREHTGTMAVER